MTAALGSELPAFSPANENNVVSVTLLSMLVDSTDYKSLTCGFRIIRDLFSSIEEVYPLHFVPLVRAVDNSFIQPSFRYGCGGA